jgi:hypothetical protein
MVHRYKTGWSYKPTNISGVSHLMSEVCHQVRSFRTCSCLSPWNMGGVRYPILSFYISSFIYTLTFQSAWERVLLSKLPALLYLDFKPNHLIVPITLMLRFSRGLYARDSSTTFYITVKGRGTRQLWADGLPDAWGNLIIFMHLEVAIKKHSVFCWHHLILIEEWNQSLMLPPKNDHGCMVWYGDWSDFPGDHFEPFPRDPSNDTKGMEA